MIIGRSWGYMGELASLSSAAGFPVVNEAGEAKIQKKTTQYAELSLRVPSYLLSKWKQHFKNTKTGSGFGACTTFGEFVLVTFRRMIPRQDKGTEGAEDPWLVLGGSWQRLIRRPCPFCGEPAVEELEAPWHCSSRRDLQSQGHIRMSRGART